MRTQDVPARLPSKLRQRWQGFACMLMVGLAGLAASGCGGTYAIPDSTNPVVYGLSMVSADDGWAVGAQDTYQQRALIAHYQGGSWMPVALPGVVPALHSIFMLSASEGWAVGIAGTILHYHAGNWSQVDSPTSVSLNSVFMTSPNEGWAVGEVILHYQQGNWTVVESNSVVLNSIFMLSAQEGWAVGIGGEIDQYTNGTWRTVKTSLEQSPALNSVTFASPDEGWAVGEEGTMLHYHVGAWTDVSIPNSLDNLLAVALVSSSEGWVVGSQEGADTPGRTGGIFHYTGGAWVQVNSPTHSIWYALAMISAGLGWAGGTLGNLLEYADGKWC